MDKEQYPIFRDLLLYRKSTNSSEILFVGIALPKQDEYGDYSCDIYTSPNILGRNATIFGVDSLQATELSLNFLHNILDLQDPDLEVRWPSGEPYISEKNTAGRKS